MRGLGQPTTALPLAPGAAAPVGTSIFSFLTPSGGGGATSSTSGGILGFLETPDPFLGLPYWVWIAGGAVIVIAVASHGGKK